MTTNRNTKPQTALEILKRRRMAEKENIKFPPLPDNAVETFICENGDVLLLGKYPGYLEDKTKVISAYSQSAYPLTKIDEIPVSPRASKEILEANNDSHNLFKKGYCYCINLNSVLPQLITVVLDLSNTCRRVFPDMNCHGASAVAAGIYPMVEYLPCSPVQSGMHQISYHQLAPGDVINTKHDHSFVFIDHDICLSANGHGKPLRFYRTEDILTEYGLPCDALITNCEKISVYRRDKERVFSESVISAVIVCCIALTLRLVYPAAETDGDLHRAIKTLYQNCQKTQNKKDVLISLYTHIANKIPAELRKTVEAECLKEFETSNDKQSYASSTSTIASVLGLSINETPIEGGQNKHECKVENADNKFTTFIAGSDSNNLDSSTQNHVIAKRPI